MKFAHPATDLATLSALLLTACGGTGTSGNNNHDLSASTAQGYAADAASMPRNTAMALDEGAASLQAGLSATATPSSGTSEDERVHPLAVGPLAHPITLTRWPVTPTYHGLHHARRRAHFGLFTTVLDRCLNTVEPDYLQALAGASAGWPLTSTVRPSPSPCPEAKGLSILGNQGAPREAASDPETGGLRSGHGRADHRDRTAAGGSRG